MDLAQRIIQYKKKINKQYLVPQEAFINETDCDEDGDKCDGKMPLLNISPDDDVPSSSLSGSCSCSCTPTY